MYEDFPDVSETHFDSLFLLSAELKLRKQIFPELSLHLQFNIFHKYNMECQFIGSIEYDTHLKYNNKTD